MAKQYECDNDDKITNNDSNVSVLPIERGIAILSRLDRPAQNIMRSVTSVLLYDVPRRSADEETHHRRSGRLRSCAPKRTQIIGTSALQSTRRRSILLYDGPYVSADKQIDTLRGRLEHEIIAETHRRSGHRRSCPLKRTHIIVTSARYNQRDDALNRCTMDRECTLIKQTHGQATERHCSALG